MLDMDTNPTTIRSALKAHIGAWPLIAQRSGISHSWISQFVREKTNNPRHMTMERIASAIKSISADPSPAEATACADGVQSARGAA